MRIIKIELGTLRCVQSAKVWPNLSGAIEFFAQSTWDPQNSIQSM